jgi:hypothetical protein
MYFGDSDLIACLFLLPDLLRILVQFVQHQLRRDWKLRDVAQVAIRAVVDSGSGSSS